MVSIRIALSLTPFISFTAFAQSGWITLSSGVSSSFHTVHFVNEDTGYVCSETEVRKTTNGGLNWTVFPVPTNTIGDLQFMNANVGYVLDYGLIHKTTNGGESWVSNVLAGTCGLKMHFVNENIGFVGACEGGVYRTTNGGVSWQNAGIGAIGRFQFASLFYTTEIIGHVIINYENEPNPSNCVVFRTSDRGNNWTTVHASSGDLRSVFFPDINTGYAVGYYKVAKSADGGASWAVSSVNAILNDVYFTSLTRGYPLDWEALF